MRGQLRAVAAAAASRPGRRNRGFPGASGLLGMRWSDTATWGGVLPDQATPIEIGVGETRILDMVGALHGGLDVNGGTLILDPAVNTSLLGPWLRVRNGGKILGGSASVPLTTSHAITVNGSRASSGVAAKFTVEYNQPLSTVIAQAWASTDLPPVANETITVTYTGTTTMTVSSSVVGALPGATAGARYNNRIHMVPGNGTNGQVFTFTFYAQGNRNAGTQRGINIDMGDLEIYGAMPATLRTSISANLAAGTQTIPVVDDLTGWKAGDIFSLGPTDYNDTASGAVQIMTVASINYGTKTITTVETVAAARYGLLQYVTDSGMSNTPGTLTNNGGDGSGFPAEVYAVQPKVIDQRAWVTLLSRNVKIGAPNDSDWSTSGFGAHMMVMGRTSKFQLHGVELQRVGQRGIFGRYPIHAHVPSFNLPYGGSFPSDGTYLGSVDWDINGCSVRDSEQRGAVFHGVVGMKLRNSAFANVKGHCIFFEDGAEWDNQVSNNDILNVSNVAAGDVLVDSDLLNPAGASAAIGGATGIWTSNPRNTITGNRVGAVTNCGIWNAWSQDAGQGSSGYVLGLTRAVTLPDPGTLLRFINGSGTLPAVGATITKGGVSGTCMQVHVTNGFMSNGTAMGSIRVQNIVGGAFSSGALTGGMTATLANIDGSSSVEALANTMNNQPVTLWEGNVVMACGQVNKAAASIVTGMSHKNNRGHIADLRFGAVNGPFRLNFHIHKGHNGYLNRVEGPIYDKCVISDTRRSGFRGQAASISLTGLIPAPLLVRESLNNATPNGINTFGITSYHRLLNSPWGIYVGYTEANYSWVEENVVAAPQGGIGTADVYTDPIIDFSLYSGKFINSVPVFHTNPPHMGDGLALGNRHHTYAGVRIGMQGLGVPAGRSVVFDNPFSTFGLGDTVQILPTFQDVVHTATKFAGIKPIARNDQGSIGDGPVSAFRLNPADNTDVGSWIMADASSNFAYVPFHHFAMPANGARVRVTYPGRTVNWQALAIGNCHEAGDSVVLAVQQNTAPTTVFVTTNWNSAYYNQNASPPATPGASATTIIYSPFADLASFLASSARGYFHEAGQNRTWVRHVGGVGDPPSWVGGAEAAVYKYNHLVIK